MCKLFALTALCLASFSAKGSDVLKIVFSSDQSLPLYQVEALLHTDYETNFYVLGKDGAVYGPLTEARFELGEDASVDYLKAQEHPSLTIVGNEINLTNLQRGIVVTLYSIDGVLLHTTVAASDSCSISLRDYSRPKILLLNVGSQTFKLLLQ